MHRLLPIALCLLTGCSLYDLIPQETDADMSVTPQPNNTNNVTDPCAGDDSDWDPCGNQGVCYNGGCWQTCAPRGDAEECADREVCAATFRGYDNDQNFGPHLCMERGELPCDLVTTERGLSVEPKVVCEQVQDPFSVTFTACIEDKVEGWTCRPSCETNTDCDEGAGEQCLSAESGRKGCAIPTP